MKKNKIIIGIILGIIAASALFFAFHPHNYTLSESKDATCTEAGYKTYRCWCGKEYTENTEPTPHIYEETVKEPTCTEAGKSIFVCKNCGDTYEEEGAAKKDHEYEETIDSERGKKVFTCKNCGDTYEEDIEVEVADTEEEQESTDKKTQQQQQVVPQPTPIPQQTAPTVSDVDPGAGMSDAEYAAALGWTYVDSDSIDWDNYDAGGITGY